ncbi:phage minor head protein [Peribacillus loiseleuriae]|uniref:phage minor head protein n=1 Tax=Peribacillus loiseleuriae TaxID=1679170 RepID=UPI003D082B74
MSKVDKLLKSINTFIQKAEEEDEEKLIDILPDIPELDEIPGLVEEFEKMTAKLLRQQRKLFLDELKAFIAKDDSETLGSLLNYFQNDLFAADEFAVVFGVEAALFLTNTTSSLSKIIMESIDKDVAFNVLSKRTTDWIESWSEELAEIMKLNTHKAIETQLIEAINAGESIAQVELRLKDLPQFDRKRARTTAITEVLTASSHAQFESYNQSPAVTGKQWKHSGYAKIAPRHTHVLLDGTIVGVNEKFDVDGELADYPRDPTLSAYNRVNCHCAMGPVVDEKIIGLSQEEKEAIRQEALQELNA